MKRRLTVLVAVTGIALLSLLVSHGLRAQTAGPAPEAALRFSDIFDGDLLTGGRTVHVRLNQPAMLDTVRGVEFYFQPENFGLPIFLGTDLIGTAPALGPDCAETDCVERGVYSVTLGENLRRAATGWGTLSARAMGDGVTVKNAGIHVYWHFATLKAEFTKPQFLDTLPPTGSFQVVAPVHPDGAKIDKLTVQWKLAPIDVIGGRNINPFEQHVLGPDLTPGGHASCVPAAVGANLAWVNDTTQWQTRSPVLSTLCGANNGDRCLVGELGFLMGTTAAIGGTSGAGADEGLVAYLTALGFKKNTDYFLNHTSPNANWVETLLGAFKDGPNFISVGVHNLPNMGKFGHFLALDNIYPLADGTAMVRLMDPHTVSNPPTTGIYRWFHMQKDGTINWSDANPGYGPAGSALLDEAQIVSGFYFFAHLDGLTIEEKTASASTVETPTSGEVPGELRGQVWMGTFTPPAGSPGPWLLASEVTTSTGHKERAFRYVVRNRFPAR